MPLLGQLVVARMRNTLEFVEVDSDRLEEVLRRAEQSLDEKDTELIRAVFESYNDSPPGLSFVAQVFWGRGAQW